MGKWKCLRSGNGSHSTPHCGLVAFWSESKGSKGVKYARRVKFGLTCTHNAGADGLINNSSGFELGREDQSKERYRHGACLGHGVYEPFLRTCPVVPRNSVHFAAVRVRYWIEANVKKIRNDAMAGGALPETSSMQWVAASYILVPGVRLGACRRPLNVPQPPSRHLARRIDSTPDADLSHQAGCRPWRGGGNMAGVADRCCAGPIITALVLCRHHAARLNHAA